MMIGFNSLRECQTIAARVAGGGGAPLALIPPHQLHVAVAMSQFPESMALGLQGRDHGG